MIFGKEREKAREAITSAVTEVTGAAKVMLGLGILAACALVLSIAALIVATRNTVRRAR